MPLTLEERKARRIEGMERAKDALTVPQKVQRALTNGRPPASELRTPHAALTAARTLLNEIRSRMEDESYGQRPRAADYFAVTVAYVTPDLSTLGLTPLYSDGEQDRIEKHLTGNIAIGLVFGIADDQEMLTGGRPFIVTKQIDAWLDEMRTAAQSEFEIDKMERGNPAKAQKRR